MQERVLISVGGPLLAVALAVLAGVLALVLCGERVGSVTAIRREG